MPWGHDGGNNANLTPRNCNLELQHWRLSRIYLPGARASQEKTQFKGRLQRGAGPCWPEVD